MVFEELRKRNNEAVGEGTALDGSGSVNKLRRYRFFKKSSGKTYYEEYLYGYLSIIPKSTSKYVREELTTLGLLAPVGDLTFYTRMTQEAIAERATNVTVFFMKYRTLVTPHWKYFLDLGYALPWNELTKEKAEKLIALTVQNFSTKPVTNDSDEYHIQYREYGLKWMRAGKMTKFRFTPTFKEFLAMPLAWGTPGASIEEGTTYVAEGVVKDTKKVKIAQTFIHTVKDLEMLIEQARNKKISVSMSVKGKEKAPKTRTISKVELAFYLVESYLATYVEQRRKMGSSKTHYASPLHTSTKEMKDIHDQWLDMMKSLRATLGLDAKAFDVNMTKFEDYTFYEVVGQVAEEEKWPNWQDVVRSAKYCVNRIKRGYKIKLTVMGMVEQIAWVKGLISGKRTTALEGTFKSAVCINIAIDQAKMRPWIIQVWTNGDDTQIIASSKVAVQLVNDQIITLNAIIPNEPKGMESPINNISEMEFLKQIFATKDKLGEFSRFGVPARSLSAIMLRSPEAGEERITALAMTSNWARVYQRGGDKKQVVLNMIKDIVGFMKVSFEDAINFLLTPLAYGGAGLSTFLSGMGYVNTEAVSFGIEMTEEIGRLKLPTENVWKAYDLDAAVLAETVAESLGHVRKRDKMIQKTSVVVERAFIMNTSGTNYKVAGKPELGPMFGILLDNWIKKIQNGKAVDSDLEKIVDEKTWDTFLTIRGRWSHAAVLMWLKGRLFVTTRNLNYSNVQNALYSEELARRLFTGLLFMRTNKGTVRIANLVMERAAVYLRNTERYQMGD